MKTKFTFSILRYVHDVMTGEFVNVGVAIYAPDAKYLSATCTPKYGRLSKMFAGVDGEYFKQTVRHIENKIEEFGEKLKSDLPFEEAPKSIAPILKKIIPADDSSLQFSLEGGGLSESLTATLEDLFYRYVEKNADKGERPSRSDDDVWKIFRKPLEEKKVISHLQSKQVKSQDDEYEFKHAWKNGKWNVLEPISFDLSEGYSLIRKAHEWLGLGNSLLRPEVIKQILKDQELKLYFLIGSPKDEKLSNYFTRARKILDKIPCEHDFFREEDAEKVADLVKKDLEKQSG